MVQENSIKAHIFMVIQLGHQILDGKAPRLFKGSDKIFRDFIYIDDVLQANINACSPNKMVFIM
jgi:ADP-L-glycero-D-manno-heptose 6-epimerase